jgi:hypothetical protein
MKRTLITVAALVGLASAASGATLTLNTDKNTYLVGETITLTVTATNAAETDSGITGVVLYTTSLISPTAGGATQTPLTSLGGAVTWTQGALATFCTDASGSCRMFSQVSPVGAQSVSTPLSPFILSTKTFVADVTGTANFNWLTSPATPAAQRLDYFGVTSSAGKSIEIVVPEPTTAALLGLGLFGLAMSGRRRLS